MGRAAGLPGTIRELAHYLASIQDRLDAPTPMDEVDPGDFDLVFYPGGHGPMEDLSRDAVSGALLTNRLASGRPLALLCHGPAAMLAAKNIDGTWPFAGYRITALSNAEEKLNSFGRKAPWFLEDRLRESGADYAKGMIPLLPHINLYIGQNPASSRQLANRLPADLTPRLITEHRAGPAVRRWTEVDDPSPAPGVVICRRTLVQQHPTGQRLLVTILQGGP
ncbi:type 1 glutamine amidotransferase domain-containing protein [Nonomuraea sp. NPDC050556]|uniref:type 1 glutamine amidotransferase domain-containing protein n=1 Tax=Nonomuraea sp. NPDC050556 TaxID=3364369 RepID=UPI0037A89A93